MRYISWTVVIGSVSVILYSGAAPLLSGFELPAVDETSVGGTLVKPARTPSETAPPADEKPLCEHEATPGHGDDVENCERPSLAGQ